MGRNAVVTFRGADVLDEFGRIITQQLFAARHERREYVFAKIEQFGLRILTTGGGERGQRRFFQNVQARVYQVLTPDFWRVRPVMKGQYAVVAIHFDQIGIKGMVVRVQQQGGDGTGFFVGLPDAAEIHVHHGIAIHHHKTVGEQIGPGQDGPGRA